MNLASRRCADRVVLADPGPNRRLIADAVRFVWETNQQTVAADAVRLVPAPAADGYYVHADHLGGPQAMTDDAQQEVWRIGTRPFGGAHLDGRGQPALPGQYADAESGYSYNYFRDYEPAIGRYLQSDPIGLSGGVNTFAYVGGNPVGAVDPTGQYAWLAWGLVGGGSALAYELYRNDGRLGCVNWGVVAAGFAGGLAGGALVEGMLLWSASLGAASGAGFVAYGALGSGVVLAPRMAGMLSRGSSVAGPGAALSPGASAAAPIINAHYSIPKFLGGAATQTLSRINQTVHTELHAMLRQGLRDAGFPLNIGGTGGSAARWELYMRANPGSQNTAFNVVLDVSRAIDARFGTQITQHVWRNIMNGNFTPYP